MYQIGDRFVVIRDSFGGPKVGDTGTLVGSIGDFELQIEWDNFCEGHNCRGRCHKDDHGWSFYYDMVDIYIQLFEECVDQIDLSYMEELL